MDSSIDNSGLLGSVHRHVESFRVRGSAKRRFAGDAMSSWVCFWVNVWMVMGGYMDVKTPALRLDDILITPEMLLLIAEIDEFKGAWRALGALSPERLDALRRVATIESIAASSRIEGGNLSDRDAELLLASLEASSLDTHEGQELVGYAEVMGTVFHDWHQLPITERTIRRLHCDIQKHN